MFVSKVYEIDLDKPLKRMTLDDLFVRADQMGHRISINLYKGTTPEDVTGASVMGYMVRADGTTAAFQGAASGHQISVQLPEVAYAVAGYATLLIRVTHSGSALSVFWASCYIHQGETGAVVTQGYVLPSLDEIVARIAQMEAATNNANAAAAAATNATTAALNTEGQLNNLVLDIQGKLARGEFIGKGLTIKGTYGNLPALQNAVANPEPGDAYAVGGNAPYTIYIWDGTANQWRDHGQLQGAKGDPGLTTSVNGVEQIGGNVQLLAGHIPTQSGDSVEQVLNEMKMTLLYDGSWATGQVTLSRAARAFRLLVIVRENSATIVPVNSSMVAHVRYPWANAGSWNIIEQFYIFNLATTTGQRLTMAATLKYLNGTYVSDADPIEKIYGIK